MPKTNAATRKSSTHFEQIPLNTVKKIAEVDSSRTMSEPRLTERRKSSRDNTPLGHVSLRQVAQTVLAQHAGSSEGAEVLAAAARRAYDDLARVCTPLIGQVGVHALIARALHLAQRDYPWLRATDESDHMNEPFARVTVSMGRQDPTVATEGAAAVLAIFARLLVTFIGEPLTAGLLRKAWPGALPDAPTKET